MHPTTRTRSRLRFRWATGVLVAALTLSLAACGDEDDEASAQAATSSTPSSSDGSDAPSGDPTESGGASPSPSDQPVVLTPPGTELSIDDPANVPITFGDAKALARMEIELERVPVTDLPPDMRPDDPSKWDLTYVHLHTTLLEGHGRKIANVSAGMNIEGESQGWQVLPMIMWEEFKPCNDAPPPFRHYGVPRGASWKPCVPILSRKKEPLDAILYTNPSNRYKNPIRWVI
ncbi:hypothetical protein [Nocardioides pacificus]